MKLFNLMTGFRLLGFSSCLVLAACSKSASDREPAAGQASLPGGLMEQASTTDFPCVDIWNYQAGSYPWAVSYPCPETAFEDSVNKANQKRQSKIDSMIRVNSWKYNLPMYASSSISPCNTPTPSYSALPIYGTSAVNNSIHAVLADFISNGAPIDNPMVFTVYVLQNGMLGGGVFMSLEQGSLVKTFGFYPQSSDYVYVSTVCGQAGRLNGVSVPGEIRNNADLPYSVSISKTLTAIQFQNLAMYLSNSGSSNFYQYNVSSFSEVHYALGALNSVGVNSLYQYQVGVNNYQVADTPYKLGQNIKTMATLPTNTTVNLNGGFTPGVSDITE